jgi:PAS domain S-box-containing protein
MPDDSRISGSWRYVIAVVVLLALGIAFSGYLYFSYQKKRIRAGIRGEISAVADLKADQISEWREERFSDARFFYRNVPFRLLVQKLLQNPSDTALTVAFQQWTSSVRENRDYSCMVLLDAGGGEIARVGDQGENIGPAARALLEQSLTTGNIQASGFDRAESSSVVHLDLAIPFGSPGARGPDSPAALLFRINPRLSLFPLVEHWPTPSRTAENLLVCREGDDVVFLSDVRHRSNAVPAFRWSVRDSLLPAARAVMGRTGVVEGVDYRGMRVLAALRSIPHTSWYLVSKVDLEESDAPVRQEAWYVTLLGGALLLAGVGAIGALWNRQQAAHSRAEAHAAASMARFSAIVESSDDAIIGKTLDGVVTSWNAGAERIYGYGREEMIGGLITTLSPAGVNDIPDLLRRIRSGEHIRQLETRRRRKDGETIDVSLTMSPVLNSMGAIIGVSTIARDITTGKRIREQLARSEEYYRFLMEQASDGIFLADQHGRYIDVNPSGCALLGYTREELLSRSIMDVVAPEELRTNPLSTDGLREGGTLLTERLLVRKDGTRIPVEISVRIRPDGLLQGIHRDISARRVAEQALRESERKYRELFQNAEIGMYRTRLDGSALVAVNRKFCEIFGYSEEELLGNPSRQLWFDAEARSRVAEEIRKTGRIIDLETEILTAAGEVRTVLASMTLYSPQGYIEGSVVDITERKKIERALWLKNIVFDTSIAANSIADINGLLTEANGAFMRLWGYATKDEVLGKPIRTFLHHPEEAVRILAVLDTADMWEGDYTASRKDGSTFIARALATVVRDEQGKKIGYQSAVVDITERQRVQEALRFHQELLAETGRIAKVGGWEFDPATGRGTWTEEAARIHDLPPTRDVALAMGLSYYQGESRARIEAAVREAVELQKPYDLELELTTAKGDHKWVRSIGHPVVVDGRVVKVRGSFQDITERKWAEELLQNSEAFLNRLIEQSPMPMWISDDQGTLLRLNQACCDLLHTSPEEVVGRYNVLRDPLVEEQGFMPQVRGVFERGETAHFEINYDSSRVTEPAMRNSVIVILEVTIFPVKDTTGRLTNAVIQHSDITERKRAEHALRRTEEDIRRLNAELEQRVARRTAQLEAANRELEAFSYSVSHDLRTPLRAIDGFSLVLAEEYAPSLDAEGRRLLGVIREGTLRMGQLIDDLLALARISRSQLMRSRVSMSAIAAAALEEVAPAANRMQADITIGELPGAYGDATLIKQVFVNLIANAWKFSRLRSRRVIEIGGRVEGEECVYFVKDNGAGFDEAYKHKLFGVFQRLHSTKEFEGTGVGLAIVQRIVSRHGGRVWAVGEVNNGATFSFTLPAAQDREDSP